MLCCVRTSYGVSQMGPLKFCVVTIRPACYLYQICSTLRGYFVSLGREFAYSRFVQIPAGLTAIWLSRDRSLLWFR